MAVLEKRKPNFYIRENRATAQSEPQWNVFDGDGEGLGVVLFATASLILFAFALWLVIAQPFADVGPTEPNQADTGLSTIGSYAPVEHLPATGMPPLLEDRYKRAIR